MDVRWIFLLFGLCFSNLALADLYYSIQAISLYDETTTYPKMTFYFPEPVSDHVVGTKYASAGPFTHYSPGGTYNRVYLSDGSSRKTKITYGASFTPDEGCSDYESEFTTTTSSNSCLTLPNGSSCSSTCGYGSSCIGVGVGGEDPLYVQRLNGSACTPTIDNEQICDGLTCSPVDTGGGDTGGGDTGGGDTGGGDTGGGDTGGGDTGGGDTGGGDTGGGDTGGGSVSTGGGTSSGDAVDAPNTDQGKDYSSQLNQLIANQDAVNKTGIDSLKNQSAIFSELKAINSNIAFSNSQSVKQNGLLTDISDSIKSLNEEKLHDIPDISETTSLQETIVDFGSFDSIIKKDYFGGSAVCPPDVSIVVMGTDLAFTYKPFCDFAAMVKPLVLLLAWGGFIFSLRHIGRN